MNGNEARMVEAKAALTRAARAALKGLPLAVAMAKTALEDLNAARGELRAIHDDAALKAEKEETR